jgi:hypothetical protein
MLVFGDNLQVMKSLQELWGDMEAIIAAAERADRGIHCGLFS